MCQRFSWGTRYEYGQWTQSLSLKAYEHCGKEVIWFNHSNLNAEKYNAGKNQDAAKKQVVNISEYSGVYFLDDVNFLFRGGLNSTTSAKVPLT